MDGWVGWWMRFLLILRLSQPSLAGVGAGAELGTAQLQLVHDLFMTCSLLVHDLFTTCSQHDFDLYMKCSFLNDLLLTCS